METATNMGRRQPAASPEAALRIARTLIGALISGPFLFWAGAWFITGGGDRPFGVANAGLGPELALAIWAAMAVGGFAVAMFFRRRAVTVVEEAQRAGGAEAVFARAGEVQVALIVAVALLEGPALFAGVMFLLFGAVEFLMYAAPILVVGAALTFPRAEWFGVDAYGHRR